MANVERLIEYRYGYNGTDERFTEPYRIVFDAPVKSALDVIYATGVPRVFDPHPDNQNYKVARGGINVKRIDEKVNTWHIDVTYEKVQYSFNASSPDEDRLLAFSVGTVVYQETAEGAYLKRLDSSEDELEKSSAPIIPLQNSAGDLLDPSNVQNEYYNRVITFTLRERARFDYVGVSEKVGYVNSTTVNVLGFSIEPRQGLVKSANPEMRVDEDGDQYWVCHYELEIARPFHTHDLFVLDAGFNYLKDGKLTVIKESNVNDDVKDDEDGPRNDLTKLDGHGELLLDQNKAEYWEYWVKPEIDWNDEFDFINEKIKVV